MMQHLRRKNFHTGDRALDRSLRHAERSLRVSRTSSSATRREGGALGPESESYEKAARTARVSLLPEPVEEVVLPSDYEKVVARHLKRTSRDSRDEKRLSRSSFIATRRCGISARRGRPLRKKRRLPNARRRPTTSGRRSRGARRGSGCRRNLPC